MNIYVPEQIPQIWIEVNDKRLTIKDITPRRMQVLAQFIKNHEWDLRYHVESRPTDYGYEPIENMNFTMVDAGGDLDKEMVYFFVTGRSINALADNIQCDDCDQSYNSHGVSVFKNNHVGWDSVLCNDCIGRNYENPSYKNWSE